MIKYVIKEVEDYGYIDMPDYDYDDNKFIIAGNDSFIGINKEDYTIKWIDYDEGEEDNDDAGEYSIEKTFSVFGSSRAIYHIINSLNKATGLDWKYTKIYGDSQGDWNYIFYTGNIEKCIKWIEDYYFGKYKVFSIDGYNGSYHDSYIEEVINSDYYDNNFSYKEVFSTRLGVKPDEIEVKLIKGYKRMPVYEDGK